MDAIELLERDHRDVEDLFDAFDRAESAEDKQAVFAQIADALAVHATLEERHFYPHVMAADEALVQESLQEHRQVKVMLAELLDMDPDDARFEEKLFALQDEVEDHVDDEEEELFPKVREECDADLLDVIGERMAATRVELEAEGAPRDNVPAEIDRVPPR